MLKKKSLAFHYRCVLSLFSQGTTKSLEPSLYQEHVLCIINENYCIISQHLLLLTQNIEFILVLNLINICLYCQSILVHAINVNLVMQARNVRVTETLDWCTSQGLETHCNILLSKLHMY